MRRSVKMASIGLIGGLILAGCGEPPAEQSGGGEGGGEQIQACMVLDVGGVDDKSFNEASWAGLQEAEKANPSIKASYVSSSSQNDYEPNLNAQVNKGCKMTIAVGGLMADAVKKVAKQHPDSYFAEVDAPASGPNVYGMQYNTAQPAFMAGYLAAGMSKTGKVATFGGLPIPPVTIFMDGFYEGVQYYNEQKGEDVRVLGWNAERQDGTFAQSFTDKGKGKSIANSFINQGADIIHPPAGATGLGAGAAIKESGGEAKLIWYDTDGCVSAKAYCEYILTSVTKHMTKTVKDYAVTAAEEGTPPTGNYIGTLENGGVGLAPFHEFEDDVPADLKKELDQIKQDIIDGKIKLKSPAQPKSDG